MDPGAFVRVSVAAVGLRIPLASKAARIGVHAISMPCFCDVKLAHFPVQTASVPLITPTVAIPDNTNIAAAFYLDGLALQKLLAPSCLKLAPGSCLGDLKRCFLEVVVYTGKKASHGVKEKKILGSFSIPVSSEWGEGKPLQLYNGWVCIGKKGGRHGAELHLNVKLEADPRYVFQFDGDTALNPQIIQMQGRLRQPIFSCKFSRDRSYRSRLGFADTPCVNSWSAGDREREKERKRWLVMIHDLSGSPVAAASVITPFVPSSGSNFVNRSNPGCWLILRPDHTGVDSWEPWGRLEAWRERGRGKKDGLGLRFQLVAEGPCLTGVGNGILISEMIISSKNGGEFVIDTVRYRPEASSSTSSGSPTDSPGSSGDSATSIGLPIVGGFVMSCPVPGEKKRRKLSIQLSMRHIACVEDSAVFLALAAAVDLSIDACQPFTRKLKKELCEDND